MQYRYLLILKYTVMMVKYTPQHHQQRVYFACPSLQKAAVRLAIVRTASRYDLLRLFLVYLRPVMPITSGQEPILKTWTAGDNVSWRAGTIRHKAVRIVIMFALGERSPGHKSRMDTST